MNKITFYIYDDTENRFENANNNVKKYLFDEFQINKDIDDFITKNDHPAGDDCMCVTVSFQDFEIEGKTIKSFLGNTVEYKNHISNRPKPKKRPNRKNRIIKEE